MPSILTIWLFVWGYNFIHKNISQYINHGLVHIIALASHDKVEVSDSDIIAYLEEKYPELKNNRPELEMRAKLPENKPKAQIWVLKKDLSKVWIDGYGSIVGFIIAVIVVCFVGVVLASYVGKTLWKMAENFIMSTPILKSVYPYIKQVTDFFLSGQEDKKQLFSRVVAVEYPRQGIWSIGYVTGSGLPNVVSKINTARNDFLTVFIPTSPTPFTGFVITVPKSMTIELNITIEESFRFVVSGGVITPAFDTKKMNEDIKESIKVTTLKN